MISLLQYKITNFTQNSFEENTIILSIVEKILNREINLPQTQNVHDKKVSHKRINQLYYVKQKILLQLLSALKRCDQLLE